MQLMKTDLEDIAKAARPYNYATEIIVLGLLFLWLLNHGIETLVFVHCMNGGHDQEKCLDISDIDHDEWDEQDEFFN